MSRARNGGGGRRAGRLLAFGLGVCLAAAATAALVVTQDPKVLRLAVVGALWAFVLAAIAVPRRRSDPVSPVTPAAADAAGAPGTEVELRRTYEVELEREVAARREYELQLEVYLRRELEQGLREDVESLRDEIQRLRGEVIDRLDGELRMERIETTRLIGGSLRALQDEARRLGVATGDLGRFRFDEPSFTVGDAGPGIGRPELPAGSDEVPGSGSAEPDEAGAAGWTGGSFLDPGPPVAAPDAGPPPPSYEPAYGAGRAAGPAGAPDRGADAEGEAPYRPRRPGDDSGIPAYPTAPPPPDPDAVDLPTGRRARRADPADLPAGRRARGAEPADPGGDPGDLAVPDRYTAGRDAAGRETARSPYSSGDELDRIFSGGDQPPSPRGPVPGESGRRHRRYRDDDEPNDVLSRLLGRG